MKNSLLLLFVIICAKLSAQDSSYFQQAVNYEIDVTLNDTKHELYGFERVEYINNSPDTLRKIYFHLWPNAYKNNNTALGKQLIEERNLDYYYAHDSSRGYIDSLNFEINDEAAKWYLTDNIDIAVLELNEPLLPTRSIIISTPFKVKIPSAEFSRLGHAGQQYQITQWYPKPAVYDNKGWHPMPYLNQGEFYSEFGNFKVSITLPENYVVGATGDLQTESEIDWIAKKAISPKQAKNLNRDLNDFPKSSSKTKTIVFKQDRVHDFAWFADKRYNILADTIHLPNKEEPIQQYVLFTNQFKDGYSDALTYTANGIKFYSKHIGNYPYNIVTVVEGALSAGAGMEYPTITIIGGMGGFPLEETIVHEIGHNWFYGIFGSNERKSPWLDEGFNTFFQYWYISEYYPNKKLLGRASNSVFAKFFDIDKQEYKTQNELLYLYMARQGLDQPIGDSADYFSRLNYGAIAYGKAAMAFDYLRGYLGDRLFKWSLEEYYKRWAFKHPDENSLRDIFEQAAGKDLSWFFDDIINSSKKLDYQLVTVEHCSYIYTATVRNSGDIIAPYSITGIKDGEPVLTEWFDGHEGTKTIQIHLEEYDEVVLNYYQNMPEINRRNNRVRTKGLFKRVEPLKIQFFNSLENPSKTQIFWTPTLQFNNYDKVLIGASFYNGTVVRKNFDYRIGPDYSTGTSTITGLANMSYSWYPLSGIFNRIKLGVYGHRYHYDEGLEFRRFSPSLNITFRKPYPRSETTTTFRLRGVVVDRETADVLTDDINPLSLSNASYNILDARFEMDNVNLLTPYKLSVDFQYANDFSKIQAEADFRFITPLKKRLQLRFFGGVFLNRSDALKTNYYSFGLSGTQDYLFDLYLLGRSDQEGIFSRQFFTTDGGFKGFTNIYANGWMATTNAIIPFWQYAGVFMDMGLYSNARNFTIESPDFYWMTGLQLGIVPDFIEIYFPIADKQDFMFDREGGYFEQIRFVLNLDGDAVINRLKRGFY